MSLKLKSDSYNLIGNSDAIRPVYDMIARIINPEPLITLGGKRPGPDPWTRSSHIISG